MSLLDHFYHRTAGLFALTAFFGALRHMFVIRNRLALLRAAGAGFGARFADQSGEGPVAGGDLAGGRTQIGAVATRPQGDLVGSLTFTHHVRAVRKTGLAHSGTTEAGFRTRFQMIVVPVRRIRPLRKMRRPDERRTRQCKFTSIHDGPI
jgi:hypothetical protein